MRIIRSLIYDPETEEQENCLINEQGQEIKAEESKAEAEEENANSKKNSLEHQKKMRELFITIKCMYVAKYLREDNIPNEILPRVYLGSIGSALSIAVLKQRGVTHILTVADKIKSAFPNVLFDFVSRKKKLLIHIIISLILPII